MKNTKTNQKIVTITNSQIHPGYASQTRLNCVSRFLAFVTKRNWVLACALILGAVVALGLSESAFATNYSVTYHDNVVSDMPVDVSSTTLAPSVTLSSQTPVRNGFVFNGWCTTLTADGVTCTGTQYAAAGSFTLDQIANNNLNLYAMWEFDAPKLQNWTGCGSLNTGDTVKLVDNRDGQVYNVGKTADGQCWMLQNLRLGSTVTQANPTLTLTPANSNISANYTLNYNEQPEGGIFHSYTIDDVKSVNNSTEYYCNNAYGCYYNWYTATAGAGTSYVASGEVNTSICPAGWSLPTQAQFSALYDRYPSASAMLVDNPAAAADNDTNPPKLPGFLLSGLYDSTGAYLLGRYGVYWSRSAYSARSAYFLLLHSSVVNPSSNNYKYAGFAVRCVRQ